MAKKILCPDCINRVDPQKLYYYCRSFGEVIEAITTKEKKNGVKCRTDGCNNAHIILQICPYCYKNENDINIIPNEFIDCDTINLNLIGGNCSGSTNYLHIMLNELSIMNGIVTTPITAQTKETHNTIYEDIYINHEKPPPTVCGYTESSIWKLKNINKKKGNKVFTKLFNIYNGAGEDYCDMIINPQIERIITESNLIIFVIDPLEFDGLRNSLNDDDYQTSTFDQYAQSSKIRFNSLNIISNVADCIRVHRGINNYKTIDMLVAVVFSKMDLFFDKFKVDLPNVSQINPHNRLGHFDSKDCEIVNKEMRAWINNFAPSFITLLDANFNAKKCKFFGISSYGSPPKSEIELPNEILPHRVLDPILWLLAEKGFIDKI